MIRYFKPYEGDKPYVFVSYAHKNSKKVLEIINRFRDELYLLWYDEGIPAGSDWPENIASHMKECDSVLLFTSKEFYESGNCLREKQEAENQGKKIFVWELDADKEGELILPEYLKGTEEDYRKEKKIKRKFNWWIPGFIAAIGLIALAVFAAGKITAGRSLTQVIAEREDTAQVIIENSADVSSLEGLLTKNAAFYDKVTENTVKRALNTEDESIPLERLLEIETFAVCGNLIVENPSEISYMADGEVQLNGNIVLRGPIADAEIFSYMLNLKTLILSNEQLTDISPLSTLLKLEYLDLSNNDISDLSVLSTMDRLTVLHIEHTSVSSIDELKNLKSLQCVYISTDMLPFENDTDIRVRVTW